VWQSQDSVQGTCTEPEPIPLSMVLRPMRPGPPTHPSFPSRCDGATLPLDLARVHTHDRRVTEHLALRRLVDGRKHEAVRVRPHSHRALRTHETNVKSHAPSRN
jgi:hypothetical protein